MKISNQAKGMKSIFKTPFIALVAIVIAFTFYGCAKQKNPFEGLKLVLNGGALVSPPSTFYVLNAETGLPDTAAFNNATVNITGDNAANVYNSAGKKEFKIVNGVIQISFSMIPPSGLGADTNYAAVQNISEAAPWKYNLVIKVPGYNEMVYPVIATNPYPNVHEINLSKVDASFFVVDKDYTKGTSDANGLITAKPRVKYSANSNELGFFLNLNERITDKIVNPMSGTVDCTNKHYTGFNPQLIAASYTANIKAFGNLSENTIIDLNGNTLKETFIYPINTNELNVKVDGKEVFNISPANANDTFNFQTGIINVDGLINPLTGTNFKTGDKISILSQRFGESNWVLEKSFLLPSTSYLERMFITHPGKWVWAVISKPVYVDFALNDRSGGGKVYGSLNGTVDYFKPDGSVFFSEKIRGTTLSPGGRIVRLAVKPHMPMKLRNVIFKVNYPENGIEYILYKIKNPMANNIIPTPNLNITFLTSPKDLISRLDNNSVEGRFRGACSGSGSKKVVLPLFYPIYYIEESKAATTPLYQWKNFEASVDVDAQWNTAAIPTEGETTGVPYRFYTIYNNIEFKKIGTLPIYGGLVGDIEFDGLPCSQ